MFVRSAVALFAITTLAHGQTESANGRVLKGLTRIHFSPNLGAHGFTEAESAPLVAKVKAQFKQRGIKYVDDLIEGMNYQEGNSTLGLRLIRTRRANVTSLMVTIYTQDIAGVLRNRSIGSFHTWEWSKVAIVDRSEEAANVRELANDALNRFFQAWARMNP